MAANNTPMPDLIELSSINTNATFTASPGGGGDIIGVVDNATYTDGDPSNSSTQLAELNETFSSNGGTMTIDGVEYNIQLAVPDSSFDDVTVTYDNGGSSIDLSGSGASSQIVFITASPVGGGADRYFAAIDDGVGDLPNITSIQTRDLDFTVAGDDVEINLDQNQNVAPVCFTPGTMILTEQGDVPIELLRVGQNVMTVENGMQPIRWIGSRTIIFSEENEKHRPVQLKAGCLGEGTPRDDLTISPQHGMVFEGEAVRRLFGVERVLARAKGLTALPGVRVKKGKRRETYIALLLDQHQLITANGATTESFYPGPMSLKLLAPDQLAEIKAIFPEVREDPDLGFGPPACRFLTRTESRNFAMQLKKRAKVKPGAPPKGMRGAVLKVVDVSVGN